MLFIGTVNVGNIVAPETLRESPIAEKIVSNSTSGSTGGTTMRAEGATYPGNMEE
jgi:hypothetical protein